MQVAGKVVVVTGGGHGIGAALCRRFAAERARAVVVADVDAGAARRIAAEVSGMSVVCDVAQEADVRALADAATRAYGQIDLFCSNAGIFVEGGVDAPDSDWDRIIAINFKAHLYAARAVLPQMIARREGYLLQVVSAAGLLTQIGSALYATTKHAALGLAEWIAMEHGDQGIKVSAVCPQGVRTRMLLGDDDSKDSFLKAGSVSPEEVADAVIAGLAAEKFLILPHPEVATYFQRKANDYDRWLAGMRRLRAKVREAGRDA
ncbi:MAG: SDR family oxidoreductase [Bryobacterales bacterium]|nr:SDR family oxidoreductase [Bryobacterales bacterium]